MKQRDVQDENNTRWQCMQAFAGTDSRAAEEATQKIEQQSNTVPVICTPSGGGQTVRLNLEKNWNERLSDDALIIAITSSSKERES
jgi:hypothetical protein